LRFVRLRLNGFKSFVDPTDLIVSDGLTGIVGPNGCGKSNLLEALRWVMGENRPTAMRGGGMEDVIFAGASSRPARNFAEVNLFIDNSERLAPSGFNDSDLLEITRRITRDAGSAFKVNSRDVRARDVTMLFADASTGAHSPALVRQGQIAELINARPQARRRILEEAAGISGLYQRRHEAELKLGAAETNLLRVDDVVEQLAGQLAQLARQARQAARYREIGEALRMTEGVLLFRRWSEAEEARERAEAALRDLVVGSSEAERLARQAAQLREAQETELPPLREAQAIAGSACQRLIVERDGLAEREAQAERTVETLQGRIVQLGQDIEREEALKRDAGDTIERLTNEAAEIAAQSDGHDARLEAAGAEARDAASILQEREEKLAELTEDVARLAARHQSADRMLSDSRSMLEKSEGAAGEARATADAAGAALSGAEAALSAAGAAQADATTAAEAAELALVAADEARAEAQAREAEARAGRSEAEGECNALRAEVAALTRLVERDTHEGGQVVDMVRVEPGYERALGAALADDLRAPVVAAGVRSGWAELPSYGTAASLPADARPLSDVVTVPGVLQRRIEQIGLVSSDQGERLQADLKPGQRLVSAEGDLWRWDGFRAGAEDAPSAAALRLQQLNRLQELRRDLEEAAARAEGASKAHEHLKKTLSDLTAQDRDRRDQRRQADAAATEASRALSRAEADSNIAAGKLESARLAMARHDEEAAAARQREEEAKAQLAGLDDLGSARAAMDELRQSVEAARTAMMSKRTAHDEMRREGEARTRRAVEITAEISGWKQRLGLAGQRIAELDERKSSSQADLGAARSVPGEIAEMRSALADKIGAAEARRKTASDALAEGEAALHRAQQGEREAERKASEARESRAAAEARAEAARDVVEQAADRISDEQELSPQELLENLGMSLDQMPAAQTAEIEVNRLRRQRDALGAVNLRAEEDAREVQEEHDQLVAEKTDLEGAIAKLRTGITNLNREGRERLLTAFEQVNTNFSALFKHLFDGGEAKLVLVESDDPLEAGLEIMCQPPGKKLATMSLLSGGEQTLTALALIFAVFQANPAPICVLDEVDAPLDDANVTRFCDLLDEMTRQTETRFLIITHHAVTMSRMDRLFGVTMAEHGVSQLVSVDLKAAERMVA